MQRGTGAIVSNRGREKCIDIRTIVVRDWT